MTDRPYFANPLSPPSSEAGYLPGRRLWQIGFVVVALVPLTFALLALAIGTERFLDADDVNVGLDSTYRYLGGIYLATALLALWAIPRIEERADVLVYVSGAIFLGGLGRLFSIAAVGVPSAVTWPTLVLELGTVFAALIMRRSIQPVRPS